jgi:hypothetical protein
MACVYKHIRIDTNETFYIGIGKTKLRAYNKYNRSKYWKSIVNKIDDFLVQILHDDISWEEACEKEKEYIQYYGRANLGKGSLCNLTDGGEGILNLKHTIESKSKISEATKKRFKETSHVRKGCVFTNKNSKAVVLVDLKTYIIYSFDTLVKAGLFLKTNPSRVRRACLVSKSINNFYLKFGSEITEKEIAELKIKTIYDLSLININKDYTSVRKKVINTKTNKIYNSLSEVCKKYKIPQATLSRQLNGVSKNKTVFKLI